MGLQAEIWAWRLGEGGGAEEEEKEEEKFPHVRKHRSSAPLGPLPCSPLNFNHNLLKQGTGTADH